MAEDGLKFTRREFLPLAGLAAGLGKPLVELIATGPFPTSISEAPKLRVRPKLWTPP